VSFLPAINLSPVSLLPSINYRRCHNEIDENTGQGLITGVNDTGNNLSPVTLAIIITGVVDTGEQLDTGDKHKVAIISANFCKNSKWPQGDTQRPGGNLIITKT
jgi:hypothetical protein